MPWFTNGKAPIHLSSHSYSLVIKVSPAPSPLQLYPHTGHAQWCQNADEVDVVPVLPATRNLWTHDPFGGEYDGTYIWGRGSSDDKSGLIGIMSVPPISSPI